MYQLRANNIANIPFSAYTNIACPVCIVNKAPPPMRKTVAIVPPKGEVVQSWDHTADNEGGNGILHVIDNHKWEEVYLCNTEKIYVVMAAMVKNWEEYDPPDAVRCDNGPAFASHFLQMVANVYGIKIRFIQPGESQQNGAIENAHKPHHASVRSLLIQYPHLTSFEAHIKSVNIRRKQFNRALGCSPWQYRYGKTPRAQLSTTIPALQPEHPVSSSGASSSTQHGPAPIEITLEDTFAIQHGIRKEADLYQEQYQKQYDGKSKVKDTHARVGDLILVRIRPTVAAAVSTSKLIAPVNKGPFIMTEGVGKQSIRYKDILWGTPCDKPISRRQIHIFKRCGESSFQQMEEILLRDKATYQKSYDIQEARLAQLYLDLADRPDAPICVRCKKPVPKIHSKKMCQPCYGKNYNEAKKLAKSNPK
ncbi:hypothetical protein CYMTET_40251 [Cymbomonas tetramitiformis]|uniref:Integrase catalytic domain-containing protein n=1 Tax=Cymbomonas tetramitiformis TaxID=36881 RepID=A0AAE0CA92_9CHLO|nr:hypothetical protein CYMTET_40251 [Cymbomonas tetramitiformis]